MTPLALPVWTQLSDIALLVALTLVIAVAAQVAVNVGVRSAVRLATRRAENHRDAKPGRTRAVLAEAGLRQERAVQRAATMGSILRSLASFSIWIIALLTIMGAVGLPLAPLLASAGVGGLAIGFGAQSLVKDFLAGVFMIVEDQYGVGDVINTGEVTGTVEEVGLRVTRLRDATGQVWYVRNGEITRIGNISQGHSTAMVDVPVAWDADTATALEVLREVAATVDADPTWHDVLLETPTVLGVDSIVGNVVTLRIMLKTAPNEQWAVQREVRERAKSALAAAGIPGPALPPPAGPTRSA